MGLTRALSPREATPIPLPPKGGSPPEVEYGFKRRLVLFDLAQPVVPGYNPLRENGLRIDLQAQYVREAVKSAWGASSFDSTPLLARMLYLCLYVARAMRVSMMEALDVLRPTPALRQKALQQIDDPFVHNSLFAFDQLSDRLKTEQASSTLSRLEAFLCDQTVRQVICSPESLDLEELLTERKIILMRFARYQPVLPDTLKLLGRMFFNDLLAHIYKGYGEGKFSEKKPCYVMCDEVQNFATKQVCDALDEGRGIGFHTILAHQHLKQLSLEDKDGYLRESVMTDARTKVLFGGLNDEDQDAFATILLKRHYDPLAVKYIQKNPIFAPVESVRKVITYSETETHSASATGNLTKAHAVSHADQHSRSRGRSDANAIAFSEGQQESHMLGKNSSITESQNWGEANTRSGSHTDSAGVNHSRGSGSNRSHGSTDTVGTNSSVGSSQGDVRTTGTSTGAGESMLPPVEHLLYTEDPEVVGLSANTADTESRAASSGRQQMQGSSAAHAETNQLSETENEQMGTSRSTADARGWSNSEQKGNGIAHQTGENEAHTRGTDRSMTRGNTVTNSEQDTDGYSDTVAHTDSRSIGFSEGTANSRGKSVTLSPFYDYVREEIQVPTFLSVEEQKLLIMQKLTQIPDQHAELIAPVSGDCFFRTPHAPAPTITRRRLAADHAYVYRTVPGYPRVALPAEDCTIVDVEIEEIADPQPPTILPSSAALVQPESEEALWKRWVPGLRSRQEKK